MALTKEESLRQAIVHEKVLLTDIAHRQTESRARLATLHEELVAAQSCAQVPFTAAPPFISEPPTTAQGKIFLFRQLFRGRDDVFPKLWISSKTGRKG